MIKHKSRNTLIRKRKLVGAVCAAALLPVAAAAPVGWHKELNESCRGINLEEAHHLIHKYNLTPRAEVVVGIIDSGIDTTTVDIRESLWLNPGELPGNKDRDGNGYAGDVNGWNFLGTTDGSFNMTSAGTEEYREFKRLYPKYKDVEKPLPADSAEYEYYMQMRRKAGIDSYLKFYAYNALKDDAYSRLDSIATARLPELCDTTSTATVLSLGDGDAAMAQDFDLVATDIIKGGVASPWRKVVATHRDEFALMSKRVAGIEGDQDKRLLMGDDLKDADDIYYGNSTLQADGCEHGTFVAGVIAGRGVTDPAVTGIFPDARLMILRAVPDGDEYDKDVATAIRYAVDNGAKVVNMSLGKMTSPDSAMVNRAIAYALDHDVLLVQAAGNSHINIDSVGYYPSARSADGTPMPNYLRVGASNVKGEASPMSNYGARKVDVFAPGSDIKSNTVGNKYMTSSGTSIAAPVVSAVAAMIRAYFPELSAAKVKEILMKSARKTHHLAGLCVSEGIVDAGAAMAMARDAALWQKAERMSGDTLEQLVKGQRVYPTWIDGTPCFYYNVERDGRTRYYIANAATGAKREMIRDMKRFAADYTTITGDTLDERNPRLYGITFDKGNARSFTLKKKGKNMRYDIAKGTLREYQPRTKEEPQGKKLSFGRDAHSPDSTYSMLGSGHDLYLRENKTGAVRRITDDGVADAAHTYSCKSDTTVGNAAGFWVGNRYLHILHDQRGIKEMGIIHSIGAERPTVETFKMPMPGDSCVKRVRLYWYNPESDEGRYLPIEKYADQTVDVNYHYTPDALFFTRKSRKGNRIDLCRVNMKEGTVDELISEECEPHINLTLFNYTLLNKGREILWWSERTGRGNYYLYDSEGRLKNRVTNGETLVAAETVRIDTLGRSIIFKGYGAEAEVDPYYPLYYKVKLDGSGQQLLTPGDYVHELNLSPCGRYAIDRYSRVDEAPAVRAFAIAKPTRQHEIEKSDIAPLLRAGWVAPRRLRIKAADGKTDLYGTMFLPSDLDTTRRYPIISNVYPGPQDDQITRSFAIDDNGNQSLAEMGFVVITMPSRGSSPLRGREFYTYGYGNLRDYPLEDDKNTIEQLAVRYPFIDLDRVGIYGHSGGGFQTAAAMMTYPDFYKVGVAASGNHDNNIYIQWWGEAFHGLEENVDVATGKTEFRSSIPTNMELASDLRGKLLLITGDVDKNVPPSCTYRLADALIKKGKRFDMFVLPDKDHGVMCPYYQNMIRYYFKENLLEPKRVDMDIIHHQ